MEIHLQAWGSAWTLYTVNPYTCGYGRKTVQSLNSEPTKNGFASIEPVLGVLRRFYAIYAFEGRLFFQAGKRKWDLTDAEIETGYWCWFGLISGFRLSVNGKPVHRTILLHPSRAVWPFIDPTYDGIDFDSDHFLFFLSEQLQSDEWRKRLLSTESKHGENSAQGRPGKDHPC